MAAQTIPISVSALHEILKWAEGRPVWQRDALRRIIVNEAVEETDIEELDNICRAQHNALKEGVEKPAAVPITLTHLPPAPGEKSSIVLLSLGELKNVNRLPVNQTIIFGSSPGLTVIYGDNGSGKSGYARVLKKACRSRGAPPVIKPNAYKPKPTTPATATIVCQIAGVDKPVAWTDGQVTEAILANVFTFDSHCAAHYIVEDGPSSFTPYGLDILPKLSHLSDRLRERIQADIVVERAAVEGTSANWKVTLTTPVGILIGSLSETTKSTDVDAISIFTDSDKERLEQLHDVLKSNAKQKAKETRASAARLKAAAKTIEATQNTLSDTALDALKKLIEKTVSTSAAAELFSQQQFDDTYLLGTGGELWRELWRAAQSYSSESYAEVEFPNTEEDARCLLCQRPIDEEAAKRFTAFKLFCNDQSHKLAAKATASLTAAALTINALSPLTAELEKIEADFDGISDANQLAIKEYIKTADARLVACQSSVKDLIWIEAGKLTAVAHSILTERAKALEERAVTEESADDPEARGKLLAEHDALADRQWLVGAKDDVFKQIGRLKRIALWQKCLKDTSTNAITAKSSELTKQIVTKAYCERFQDEIKGLGLRTITVEMQEIEGHKGETRFGLRLKGADGHNIQEIASEGEQRCIGLAAFLAELCQASHKSTLVFDDPVSSLDHWHRERIAKRLIEEAKIRQVVVFTHETTFLNDLVEASTTVSLQPTCKYLEWSSEQPGICCDGLPWDHKQPEERLVHLDSCLVELKKKWSPQPNEANRNEMKTAYSKLRNTLERVVEHVMLADVVFRFRRKINMNALHKVLGLVDTECNEVLRLYQRCHNLIDGHDSPSGQHVPSPEPSDLDADIAAAKKLIETIRHRQAAAAQAVKVAKPIQTKAATGTN